MIRRLVVWYVGFIVTLITAGMVIASASGFGSKIIRSSETVKISDIDTSEFSSEEPSEIYIEIEGPIFRDLLENNPFEDLPE